jgi:hypothetical protein
MTRARFGRYSHACLAGPAVGRAFAASCPGADGPTTSLVIFGLIVLTVALSS